MGEHSQEFSHDIYWENHNKNQIKKIKQYNNIYVLQMIIPIKSKMISIKLIALMNIIFWQNYCVKMLTIYKGCYDKNFILINGHET